MSEGQSGSMGSCGRKLPFRTPGLDVGVEVLGCDRVGSIWFDGKLWS